MLKLFNRNADNSDQQKLKILEKTLRKGRVWEIDEALSQWGTELKDKNSERTILFSAVALAPLHRVKRVVAAGADVNARDVLGQTPLMHLVGFDSRELREEIFNHLVQNGADINATDNKGDTALHIAAELGQPFYAERLMDAGADWRIKNKDGITAYDIAVENKTYYWIKSSIEQHSSFKQPPKTPPPKPAKTGNPARISQEHAKRVKAIKTLRKPA